MRLYIDLDTGRLIEAPRVRQEVRSLRFKRGDQLPLQVRFLEAGARPVALPGGASIRFGLKKRGEYDEGYLASATAWAEPGDPAADWYEATLSLNTVELNDELLVDGDASNDRADLECMAELSWDDGAGNWSSSQTIACAVDNDVNRGDEGLPAPADPPHVGRTDNPHQVTAVQAGAVRALPVSRALALGGAIAAGDRNATVVLGSWLMDATDADLAAAGFVEGDEFAVRLPGNVETQAESLGSSGRGRLRFRVVGGTAVLVEEDGQYVDHAAAPAPHSGHARLDGAAQEISADTHHSGELTTDGQDSTDPQAVPNLGEIESAYGARGTLRQKIFNPGASEAFDIDFSSAELGVAQGVVKILLHGNYSAGAPAKRVVEVTALSDAFQSGSGNIITGWTTLCGASSTGSFRVDSVSALPDGIRISCTNERAISGSVRATIINPV